MRVHKDRFLGFLFSLPSLVVKSITTAWRFTYTFTLAASTIRCPAII